MADYPTLTINPAYPIAERMQDATIKTSFEAGYVQTRQRFTRIRRVFDVSYEYLPNADKVSLDTFISDTAYGGSVSFNWTHPVTSTVYIVRFQAPPTFTYLSSYDSGYWAVDFILEEV